MVDIVKYDVLDRNIDINSPVYDKKKGFLKFKIANSNYKYYVQARIVNKDGSCSYFILLGKDKFNKNCKCLIIDEYGWYKIYLYKCIKDDFDKVGELIGCGEMAKYECNVEYVESCQEYDVFEISVV